MEQNRERHPNNPFSHPPKLGPKVIPVANEKMITIILASDLFLAEDSAAIFSANGSMVPVANPVTTLMSKNASADLAVLSIKVPADNMVNEIINHLWSAVDCLKNILPAAAIAKGMANAGMAMFIKRESNSLIRLACNGATR